MERAHKRWWARLGLVVVAVALVLGSGATAASAHQQPSKWLGQEP